MAWFGRRKCSCGSDTLFARALADELAYQRGYNKGISAGHSAGYELGLKTLRSESPRPGKSNDYLLGYDDGSDWWPRLKDDFPLTSRFGCPDYRNGFHDGHRAGPQQKDSLMAKETQKTYYAIIANDRVIETWSTPGDAFDNAKGRAKTLANGNQGVRYHVAAVIGSALVEQPTIWTDYE